jgi:NDP-sugar pyrophosphorylase family protein
VSDRPKFLVQVHGRPLARYLLDQLAAAGVRQAVLCTGHLAAQVEETLGDRHGDVRLTYSVEFSPLGTGGALRAALPVLRSENLLVINGDSFCEADLPAMQARHQARAGSATLLLAWAAETGRYGRIELGADGAVLAFEEKGSRAEPGWINAGVYLIRRRMLETIPPNVPVSLEREVFPAWIGRGLYGDAAGGRFLDIGTPETYAQADEFFARRQSPRKDEQP